MSRLLALLLLLSGCHSLSATGWRHVGPDTCWDRPERDLCRDGTGAVVHWTLAI